MGSGLLVRYLPKVPRHNACKRIALLLIIAFADPQSLSSRFRRRPKRKFPSLVRYPCCSVVCQAHWIPTFWKLRDTKDSAGLPLIYLYNRYPRLIKPTLWLGLAMNTVSLLAASWMHSVTGLIVLQGIFPGESRPTIFDVTLILADVHRSGCRALRFPDYSVDSRVRLSYY